MKENVLSKQYSPMALIRFAMPNIIMMIFMSLYTIIDGMFISRLVSTIALSSVNMAYPLSSVQLGIGIMIGTGGSAVIAKKMGEQKNEEARQCFTCLVAFTIGLSLLVMTLCLVFLKPILLFLGTSAIQMPDCLVYSKILMSFTPMLFLQVIFQSYFVTAGKPKLGLWVIVLGGVANVILDYLFMGVFGWGIAGAAMATGIGYSIPAVIAIVYFFKNKSQSLYFVSFHWDGGMLAKACINGSSEMISNVAIAITTFLFNLIFMYYWKEEGVASITIVQYYQFVFSSIFIGFSLGIAPIISYKYGAKDYQQLHSITKFCIMFVSGCALMAYFISIVTIEQSLMIFTQDPKVFEIVTGGFSIFALSFILMGLSVFASGFFTALNDGLVSGIISFSRTFFFLIGCMILFPFWFGSTGVWWAVPVAEFFGVIISICFLIGKRKKYGY